MRDSETSLKRTAGFSTLPNVEFSSWRRRMKRNVKIDGGSLPGGQVETAKESPINTHDNVIYLSNATVINVLNKTFHYI